MSPNELDDLLRKKEAEFDVPFREEYWEKAQELLQRERRYRPAAFWNPRTLGLTGVITLLGGMAAWYLLSTNPVSNTAENNSVAKTSVQPTPYFESRDNNVATNNNANVSTNEVSNGAIVNDPATGVSTNNEVFNSSTASTNNNATISTTASVNSASRNVNSGNISVNTSSRVNTSSTKSFDVVATGNSDLNTALNAVRTLNRNRITYRNDNLIPVFEDMTPNDPALLKFYGLYYKSSATPSRKIREFKHGAQYPQISWAAAGGLNVFNHLKEHADSQSYISTNPYLGVKFGYQWNPKWGICIQPTFVQRGGVRLFDRTETFVAVDKVTAFRHLYYVQLPVTIGVQLTKRNNVNFGGGASVLVATGSRIQDVETEKIEGGYHFKQSDGFKRLDYFATVGYQFRMNKKIGLQAAFKYGLTDVTKNAYFGSAQSHHNMQASLGVTYQFYQEKLQLR